MTTEGSKDQVETEDWKASSYNFYDAFADEGMEMAQHATADLLRAARAGQHVLVVAISHYEDEDYVTEVVRDALREVLV